MKFEWDESKARTNFHKHGVDLVDAARIFDDQAASHVIDERMDYGEERIEAIGIVDGVVLVVIYVERGEFIRLISARKATRLEEHDHLKERWAGPD